MPYSILMDCFLPIFCRFFADSCRSCVILPILFRVQSLNTNLLGIWIVAGSRNSDFPAVVRDLFLIYRFLLQGERPCRESPSSAASLVPVAATYSILYHNYPYNNYQRTKLSLNNTIERREGTLPWIRTVRISPKGVPPKRFTQLWIFLENEALPFLGAIRMGHCAGVPPLGGVPLATAQRRNSSKRLARLAPKSGWALFLPRPDRSRPRRQPRWPEDVVDDPVDQSNKMGFAAKGAGPPSRSQNQARNCELDRRIPPMVWSNPGHIGFNK